MHPPSRPGAVVTLAAACVMACRADDAATPMAFDRTIVAPESPLVLDNPTAEASVWPLWGGAFAADGDVTLRAAMTAGAGGDGIVVAASGEEVIGRAVAVVRVGSTWQLQERSAEEIGETIDLESEDAIDLELTISGTGGRVEVRVGTRRHVLELDPPLVGTDGSLGTYVLVGAGSSLELTDVASDARVEDDAELGTPLRDLAAMHGITIGSATDVWPPLHDVAFERMLGRQFDLAAPSEFYWTTTRAEGRDTFYFIPADAMVNYAIVHGQRVRGYHLVWDLELPQWLLDISDAGDAVALDSALRDHVGTIVGRYRGRVQEWVVVNEAIWGPEVTGDPELAELAESPWSDVLGIEYIETSFRAAHEADPDAILLYNETGAESSGAKSDFMYDMLADLVARGVPVHGVGLQFHVDAATPPDAGDIAANMQRFADLGLDIFITELDVNLIALSGSTAEKLDVQASLFVDVLDACLSVPRCRSYTMWGFTDRHAWYDREEGAEAPLVFDADYRAKPAFTAVQERLSR
jgi:endo-1,4-beta-xylanase